MATTSSTTLSPLVAGAADLARKLAAYKATSNRAHGEQEVEHPGEESISPLDVSFGSSPNVEEKSFSQKLSLLLCKEKGILVGMEPILYKLLGNRGREPLAAERVGEDPEGLGCLPGGRLPPGALVGLYDPGPVCHGDGGLAGLRPAWHPRSNLLVGPVIIV